MANLKLLTQNWIEQTLVQLLNGPAIVLGAINGCTSGQNKINRSSGSYVTDGVKLQSVLSGTIAARFPGGTRVTAVTALQLTMSNNATSSTAGNNEAATFTPDFAVYEDANFPISNILNADRYTPWDTGSGFAYPGTIQILIDLTLSRSVGVFALLGLRPAVLTAGGVSAARAYSASTFGTWTLRRTIGPIAYPYDVDLVDVGSATSARYWKIEIDVDARTTISCPWLSADNDLGVTFGAGSSTRRRLPITKQLTPAGIPIYNTMGRFGWRSWQFRYGSVPTNIRTFFENRFANLDITVNGGQRRRPLLIDDGGLPWECDFVDGALEWTEVFGGVEAATFELESLP